MSLRRLLYHGAIYGLTSATARLLNWLLTPLYVHRLPVEDYGRLSELYSWIAFGLIATGLGMETAYFRFGRKEQLGGTFWRVMRLLLLSGLLLNFPLALAVPFISPALGYKGREALLWLAISIWMVDAWGSFTLAHQRAIGSPLRFAAIQIGHVGTFLLLNIWGVGIQGYGVEFILGANLFSSALRLIWGLAWGPPPSPSEAPSAFTLLQYGVPLAIMGLLGATNDVLDRILLARYSLVETALYGAAYKAAMALALFVQAYRQAGEPLLLGEYRGDSSFFHRSWILYHTIASIGVIFLTLWTKPLLATQWGGLLPKPLFPTAYHEALKVVPILLWANLFAGSLIQASIWYKLKKTPTPGIVITAVGSLITWMGNLYGIPRFGYIASAWTTLLAYGGMTALSLTMGYSFRGALRLGLTIAGATLPALAVTFMEPLCAESMEWRLFMTAAGMGIVGGFAYHILRKSR